MSDLLELTAAEAADGSTPATSSAASCAASTAIARWPTTSTRTSGCRGGRPELATDGAPLGGVPIGIKDLFCTEGVPSQAGSRILEDYRPPYTATAVERLARAGAPLLGKTNQDEFAMGSSTENSAYGPTLNPWDSHARAGRLVGRLGGGGRGRHRPVVDRHRHRRLDPPARRAVRHRRAQADLRRGLAATG